MARKLLRRFCGGYFLLSLSWIIFLNMLIRSSYITQCEQINVKRDDKSDKLVGINRRPEDSLSQLEFKKTPDLRVLVLTYNRAKSLLTCLNFLQLLELDGDSAELEIWIDRSEDMTVDDAVLNISRGFKWNFGPTNVNIQDYHVGIYGQWINTWKAAEGNNEIVIILEDDIDLSPYAYRWLKAAHHHYENDKDIAGYGLADTNIPLLDVKQTLKPSNEDVAFKFSRFCTFGFSPKADVWRKFQTWYHNVSQKKSFHPYTESDPLFTRWYKTFENQTKSSSMWSMWFIKFCDENKLYTVYPNSHEHLTKYHRERGNDTHLAFHRKEPGLHFKDTDAEKSDPYLLKIWYPELVNFPLNTAVYKIPKNVEKVKIVKNQTQKTQPEKQKKKKEPTKKKPTMKDPAKKNQMNKNT